MFPDPAVQRKKLALVALSGLLGNSVGLVISGLAMYASYKWFFRIMTIICFVCAILTVVFLPLTWRLPKTDVPRWRQMDLVGVTILGGSLICFMLGTTQGPIDGWNSVSFIVPFVLFVVLFPAFFLWEWFIPPSLAALPGTLWRVPNLVTSSLIIMLPFGYYACSQLIYVLTWQEMHGWSPIHCAVALLPQGVVGIFVGIIAQRIRAVIEMPRVTISIGCVCKFDNPD